MIIYSTGLKNRIAATIARAIGSNGTVAFYSGEAPMSADDPPSGEKIGTRDLLVEEFGELRLGGQPVLPKGAGYWRILDNGGLVVMQGDGDE